MNDEIIKVLSTGIFKRVINSEVIQITEINAAISLLIKADIAFDLSFIPGDQRIAKTAFLTININPATTIRITIQFEAGTIAPL